MTRKLVLVIDDDNFVRKIICDNLKLSGFQVTSAADGEQGLGMIDTVCRTARKALRAMISPSSFAATKSCSSRKPQPGPGNITPSTPECTPA
jgi:CheY-like chemotaxis protein